MDKIREGLVVKIVKEAGFKRLSEVPQNIEILKNALKTKVYKNEHFT